MLAVVSFICAFSVTQLSAQNKTEEQKIVIVEKEIDGNGKVTETKKVLVGEEARAYMKKMEQQEDTEGGTETITIDDSSRRKKIKVIKKKDGEEAEEMEYDWEGEEIPADVKKLMEEQGLSLEELEGAQGNKQIRVKRMDEKDVEVEVEQDGSKKQIKIITTQGGKVKNMEFDMEGDELPADVKEMLEKEGIDLKVLEGKEGTTSTKMIKVKKGPKVRTGKKAQLGVNIESHPGGVHVGNVMEESSAMVAGIKIGDVITAVNGVAVTSPSELVAQIKDKQAGEEIQIKYNRDGTEYDIPVLLKEAVDPSLLRDKTWKQVINGKEANFKIVFHKSLKK